jgi:DNA-binding GntR family transcriptional regulator
MTVDSLHVRGERTSRQQLSEEVAGYVREQIISGQVRPGQFLRMEPIAEAVGVSNTPVREGLLILRSEGFVQLVARRGFVVAPFAREDVRDLFWVQSVMAGELAARAAIRIGPDQLEHLKGLLEAYEKAAKRNDADQVARLGHDFHREINLAAESNRLAIVLGSVVKHLTNRFYAAIEGSVAATLEDHPALYQALLGGKPEVARAIMEQHVLAGADRLIATLEQQGLWVDSEVAAEAAP